MRPVTARSGEHSASEWRRPRRLTCAGACLVTAVLVLAWTLTALGWAGPATAADGDPREATTLALAAEPGVVAYGGSAVLSGRLETAGVGVAGAALAVSTSTDGVTWSDLAGVVIDDAGDFSLEVTPDAALGATQFRVVFAGDDALQPAEAHAFVGSEAGLSPPSVPRTVGRDSRFTASGVLQPHHPSGDGRRHALLLPPRSGRLGPSRKLQRRRRRS